MRMYDIIKKKRDNMELTDAEISFFVKGYTRGDIPDYQASALAMAIVINGMSDRETATLTTEMANSGDTVDLSRFGDASVDKHSTGGVGDKTSLIVAPIVASVGAFVAKMSGRGLGHTGGTVDKLESIRGYRTTLSQEEFLSQVERIGISVIGQTKNLAPCDKKLYALRDVTATIESIPLITSSIMSKKIAAGARSIVLDVKVGSGAFMKTYEDAQRLARKMVEIGNACGRRVSALITDMDKPLGRAIGNSLEVVEAISVLRGESKGDLYEVSIALASNMIELSLGYSAEKSREAASDAIESGRAFTKFKEWIAAQGGDVSMLEDTANFPEACVKYEVKCQSEGYIFRMDSEKIGIASVILGAGRKTADDVIDMYAGIILHKKTGEYVKPGDTVAVFYTSSEPLLAEAEKVFFDGVELSESKPENTPLIYEVIKK